ncbi:5-methylcytosine restriction system specificity protein McrC [Streptomyces sparsogenes]|uniref:McrB family protein n=1 Tax=Streptomyces sparsogenes TaxID=67365 RepID=UPI003D15F8E7
MHEVGWLREARDLLWDERQLVLSGPPGTGKTYLALKLAEFLGGGPGQVKLLQFHPSYSYKDFIEGFRPQEDPREVAFRLTAGPLRELADLASREGNRHIPHFLIIDEINRANLAKIFGELYFLLEYREQVRVPHLLRRRLRSAAQPVRHRHHEHRGPLDRPRRRGHAAALRLRRALPARGQPLSQWRPSRLNARYHQALHLVRAVLADASVQHAVGGLRVDGFLFDMNKLFEDFVTVALREACRARGHTARLQDPHHLDVAAAIRMKHGHRETGRAPPSLRQTAGQRLFPAGSRIATHSTWCVTGKRSKARSRRGV